MGKLERYLEHTRNRNFRMFVSRFEQIAISLFEWNGLPEGLYSEQLEKFLCENGQVAVFKSNVNINGIETESPILFLPTTGMADYNIYNVPQRVIVTRGAPTGNVFANLSIDECVLIKNNFLLQPTIEVIEYYSEKLSNIDSAKDLNVNASKTPFVLTCDGEKERLTLVNYFSQINCSVPLIVVDKNSALNGIGSKQVLTTGVKLDLEEYQKGYVDYKNELLTYLGINNSQIEKRERLLTDEINSNNELIEDNIMVGLKLRKQACEEINKKFGLNLSVEFKRFINEGENKNDNNDPGANEGLADTDISVND